MITLTPAERVQAGQYADECEHAANEGERLLNSGQANRPIQVGESVARQRLAARIIRATLSAQRPIPVTPANVAAGRVSTSQSEQLEPLDWHPDMNPDRCAAHAGKLPVAVLVGRSYRLPVCDTCAETHADSGVADLREASDTMRPASALV